MKSFSSLYTWISVVYGIILLSTKPLSAQIDFTFSGKCIGSATVFTPVVANPATIATYQWDFGDGGISNSSNPIHVYLATGVYSVTLSVVNTSGIPSSATHYVMIEQLPIAFFAYTTPTCNNTPVQFIDLSSTMNGYIVKWRWDFGDGNTQTVTFPNNPNIAYWYPTYGTFGVTLTVKNSDSCQNSFTSYVTISPTPTANFLTNGNCEDGIIQFTDASFSNGAGNIVNWNWDFDDPTSGINNTSNLNNPSHIYSNPGAYMVRQMVTNSNNCKDSIYKVVLVNPHPPVDFTYFGQCEDSPTQFTAMVNGSTITQYSWQFGDGFSSNLANPQHIYTNPGTYSATLTVTETNGCSSSVSHPIIIIPAPIAHFVAGNLTCSTVSFTDLSSTSTGYILNWFWNFGDGNTASINFPSVPNTTHVYANAGSYTVSLTITTSDSCFNSETQLVTVQTAPMANFSFTPNCSVSPIQFTDLSLPGVGSPIVQWLWNFGDPASGTSNTSTIQNPIHIFSGIGIYNVQLTVSTGNGCSSSFALPVAFSNPPQANFSYSPATCAQQNIYFMDLSQTNSGGSISIWQWDFGNGSSSYSQNPGCGYSSAGTYVVKLKVTNNFGCNDSIVQLVTVISNTVANFTYSTPVLNQPVQFTDQTVASSPINQWAWSFGDGNTSSLQNPTHIYSLPGNYMLDLVVTDGNGCSYTAYNGLTVPSGSGNSTINGSVYEGDQTISLAIVQLIQIDSTGYPLSIQNTVPGINNQFIFENVADGDYYLHAIPFTNNTDTTSYLPTFYLNSVFWETATTINLGTAQNPYNIHLVSFDMVDGGIYTINGQIANSGKSLSVADQEVLLFDSQGNIVQFTFTDATGNFTFNSLPAGTYAINPVMTGLTTYPFYVVLNENTSPAYVRMVISGNSITSVEKQVPAENGCKVFPNPANESITITSEALANKILIVNNLGKTMVEANNPGKIFQIDVSHFSSGIYFIKVTTENEETVMKVVVTH